MKINMKKGHYFCAHADLYDPTWHHGCTNYELRKGQGIAASLVVSVLVAVVVGELLQVLLYRFVLVFRSLVVL